jgi:aryl-alcohol dehydrogenase-like predicted oxidoreductase
MIYRTLGKSDLRVSAVGLGTWAMGNDFWGHVEDRDAIATIQAAVERGITLIDTAPAYGNGHAERLIGKAVKGRRREGVVVATKVGVQRTAEGYEVDLRPEEIRRQAEESLVNLGTDTIDLYQIHWPDPKIHLAHSLEALIRLREEGKIRYPGVCNFPVALLDQARAAADVVSSQPHYSLLEREIEAEQVRYCLDHGIGLIPYGTLGGGVLTGKYGRIPRFAEGDRRAEFYDYFHEPLWSRIQGMLERLRLIAQHYGKPLSQLVINWTLWQPGITSVLVGAKSTEQAVSNAEAAEWELSNDELETIDELSAMVRRAPEHV